MTYRSAAEVTKHLLKLERRRNRAFYRNPPPERVAPPVSLAPVHSLERAITDADVGLTLDQIAQEQAERYLRAAYAHQDKQAADRRSAEIRLFPGKTVHVPVPDNAVDPIAPTDTLSPLEQEIVAELEHIAARPAPRWMRGEAPEKTALAS